MIVFTNSGLASKEVFSFQKPGPLQFSSISFNCCGVSVASEQQHKQDLRTIYKREYDSRIHHFLPECIASFYQNALRLLPECIAPFYQNALRLLPECIAPRTTREVVTPLCCRPFSRGLQLIKVRYGLL